MSDTPTEQQPGKPGLMPADREFKPVVKGIGYTLLALAMVGTGYATFSLGYRQGYREASSSGKVTQALNDAAVRNLTCFMQSSTASNEELEAMVQDPDAALSWIQDEQIRQEAEWLLAQGLLQRGRLEHAGKLLSGLFLKVPRTPVWARRAISAGDGMMTARHPETAVAFYRYAHRVFAETKAAGEQADALSRIAAASIGSSRDNRELMQLLESLLEEATPLGHAADSLRSSVNAYLGSCYRSMGDMKAARRYYDAALACSRWESGRASAVDMVCAGAALLVQGQVQQAEQLLKAGEEALGKGPADVQCRVLALRELASAAEARGDHLQALGLLNRAEGVAEDVVPRSDLFWPCLYDQRGWLQLLAGEYAAAGQDFNKVLAESREPSLVIQSMEGAARAALHLGNRDAAVKLLTECITRRRAEFADDRDSLARVYVLLGQAQDALQKPTEAARAYGLAMGMLDAKSANYEAAAFGHARALTNSKQWKPALEAWKLVQPLADDNPEDAMEVQDAMASCRDMLGVPGFEEVGEPAPAPDAAPAAATQPAAPPARPAARSTGKAARRTPQKKAAPRR